MMMMMMAMMMRGGGGDSGGDVMTNGGGGGDDAGVDDDIYECVMGIRKLILTWAIVVMMAVAISVGRHATLTPSRPGGPPRTCLWRGYSRGVLNAEFVSAPPS